jgi:hypothetical protein
LGACGQIAGADTEPQTEVTRGELSTADVLGFEAANLWKVVQGSVQSLTLTDTRTQGAKALAVARPSGYVRLDSVKLSSTNPELGEIDRGVSANIDLMIPTQQANPYWFGSVQMYVSAPSRNLYNAFLGQVELTGMRKEVYSSLTFKFPDYAADALKGKTYSDLVFGVALNVPLNAPGTYRLDNLRIRGKLPPPPDPNADNDDIGAQSVLLEPWKSYSPAGSKVAEQTFTQGIIQIPQSFHPVMGRAGTGSATFAYRLGTSALVTCQYPAEAAGTNYVFGSCTNGARVGDLVPASFVSLTVVNGDPTAGKTRIKAQITLNPVGDEIVTGLPPIPTYFGSNAAEVQAIVSAFLEAQKSWQAPGKVLVKLPGPYIPAHDTTIRNGVMLPPVRPPEDNDPPFAIGGRLTNSDLADAGWHVNGSLAAPILPNGSRRTEFDLDIGADVYLLGAVTNNIIGVTGHAETNTPPPVGGSVPPTTSSATFCYQVLGADVDCAGPFDATTGINQPLFNTTQNIPLAVIAFPPFSVDASATLTIRANLTGGFTPTGFALGVDPFASLDARLRGGIGVPGFIGGGVSVTATLLSVDAPILASVNATIDLTPGNCKIHLTEGLSATAKLSMGKGTIAAWAEAGLCCGCFVELCWRDEWPIYRWPALAETTLEILPATPLADQDIPLDIASVCPAITDAPGNIQYPVSGQTFKQGDRSFMEAQFQITIPDDNPANPAGFLIIFLDQHTWTSSNPSDVIVGNTIRYGTPGPRLLTVVATRPGVATGTGSVAVNIVANDPAVVPSVQILSPPPNQLFDCAIVNASAAATDPDGAPGDVLTYQWYAANPGALDPYVTPGESAGTGANVSFGSSGFIGDPRILRVIVTDPDGHQSLMEIGIVLTCIT